MKRETVFRLILISLFVLVLELSSRAVLAFLEKKYPYLTAIDRSVAAGADKISPEIVHPYLGFVGNYDLKIHDTELGKELYQYPLSRFGFLGEEPLQKRSPEKWIIGILGGSFAKYFAIYGADTLKEEFKADPQYANREIVILNLAFDGYKQPQQLMTVNYFLALGGEFDMLINLDGFNEIALPLIENVPQKIFPAFPRRWGSRAAALPHQTPHLAAIGYIGEMRKGLSRVLGTPPLSLSAALKLSWIALDRLLKTLSHRFERNLMKASPGGMDYAAAGPFQKEQKSSVEIYSELAGIWSQSSLTLHQIASARNIRYFHFLQPNQYMKGAKSFTDEERKTGYDPNSIYRSVIQEGYPLLVQAGNELKKQGVQFMDLTYAFSDKQETVFVDKCCHVTPAATQDLGRRVAKLILGKEMQVPGPVSQGAAEDGGNPGSTEYALGLASAYQKNFEAAEKFFRQDLLRDAENAESHFRLAQVLLEQKKNEEAYQEFQTAMKLDPSHAEAHYQWAGILAGQGKQEEAIQHYRDAVRLKPDFIMANYNLAVSLANQGKQEEANQFYKATLKIEPKNPDDHYALGTVLEAQGKLIPAMRQFQKAVELRPAFTEARYKLGTLFAAQRDFGSASDQLTMVLKDNPAHVEALVNLGNIAAEKKSFEEARSYYEKALAADARHPRAHFNLGMILQKEGNVSLAKEHLQRALDEDPSYIRAKEELAKLA